MLGIGRRIWCPYKHNVRILIDIYRDIESGLQCIKQTSLIINHVQNSRTNQDL
jgi:hypothetical protein